MLIADDNEKISAILNGYAKKEGFETVLTQDGEETLQKFAEVHPHVILLDVMMPKLDGFAVCREIRRQSNVPVIMVTARGEDYERIMGLDVGADDYIVKPFSPGEVMARVRAVLRRVVEMPSEKSMRLFQYVNLLISLEDYSVTISGQHISLTKRETDVLWTLAFNHNKVFSRDNLLDSLWGYDYDGDPRTVDTHIKRLRSKLDAVPHPAWQIKTIWGVGYKFEEVSQS